MTTPSASGAPQVNGPQPRQIERGLTGRIWTGHFSAMWPSKWPVLTRPGQSAGRRGRQRGERREGVCHLLKLATSDEKNWTWRVSRQLATRRSGHGPWPDRTRTDSSGARPDTGARPMARALDGSVKGQPHRVRDGTRDELACGSALPDCPISQQLGRPGGRAWFMLHQSANVASIMSRRAALVTLGDLIKPPSAHKILLQAKILPHLDGRVPSSRVQARGCRGMGGGVILERHRGLDGQPPCRSDIFGLGMWHWPPGKPVCVMRSIIAGNTLILQYTIPTAAEYPGSGQTTSERTTVLPTVWAKSCTPSSPACQSQVRHM
jgi:hypothetical protein